MSGLLRVITGGQTGADAGALWGAREAGVPTGGWAPAGWMTEDGPDPTLAEFGLREAPGAIGGRRGDAYRNRTALNVIDADAVLLVGDASSPGSRLLLRLADDDVVFHVPLDAGLLRREALRDWLYDEIYDHRYRSPGVPFVLMVAGNRESRAPGIHDYTRELVAAVLREVTG